MALKRKAVGIVSKALSKRVKQEAKDAEAEEAEAEQEEEAAAPAVLKRPAAAAPAEDEADAEEEDAEEGEGEDEDEEEELSEEQKVKQQEEEETARRTKELKAMPVNDLKELATSLGLAPATKAEMVTAVVKHEAKERAAKRAHEARLREVVVGKKAELEVLSMSELAKLCTAGGIKGVMSKQDRVQHLLKQWQEEDGINKALAKMAHDARRQSLEATEKATLKKLCEKSGVDPFVSEVIVDRICKREQELGFYVRPASVKQQEDGDKTKEDKDLVASLLATEKTRKVDKEKKLQREEADAAARKELRAMTVEDLKKELTKRGEEPAGKKEEMVDKLFTFRHQEQALTARKAELKALSAQDFKELVLSKGIQAHGKEKMIDALLASEAKAREELKAWDDKAAEISAQKQVELNDKTLTELKELLEAKGLKVGGGKDEKVQRLVEELRRAGEVEAEVCKAVRLERKQALSGLPRDELVALGNKLEVDALVKEVMVERLISYECEHGTPDGDAAAPPAAKKARAGKK